MFELQTAVNFDFNFYYPRINKGIIIIIQILEKLTSLAALLLYSIFKVTVPNKHLPA